MEIKMEVQKQLTEQPNHCPTPSIDYIIVKLAARCNIACTYCYWFKDESVYAMPKRMPYDVQEKFIERVVEYLTNKPAKIFALVFHGGEPLLFGKKNFDRFCSRINESTQHLETEISFGITTNGLLIDQEWIDLFIKHEIAVTVSIDGDQEMNDAQRIDFKGDGTHTRVVKAINLLIKTDIQKGYLAVCNPRSNPAQLLKHFFHDLKIKSFDVLIPEITHDDPFLSIADYYIKLFDDWFDNYSHHGVSIRIIDSFIKTLLGQVPKIDAIGYGDVTTVTLHTDGQFGGSDEVNTTGNSKTYRNVFDDPLSSVYSAPDWKELLDSSRYLNEKCNQCRYKVQCGGGSLQTRWRDSTRFDNPSVYCDDYQRIFDHIAARLVENLEPFDEREIPLKTECTEAFTHV